MEPDRVRIIHHGVRELAYPLDAERENVILNVGVIQKRKNVEYLVEAFESVDRDCRLPRWRGRGATARRRSYTN